MIGRFPISLPQEYNDILKEIEGTSNNFFITGKAGTGKSTLLQLIRNTSKKRIAIVAPTGVAALNVKGQTIHSFFKFPPKFLDARDIVKVRDYRLYQNIDCLIIDEISMVRSDMFDNIDAFLRKNRGNDDFFGGVQVVVFGDLFQLPPVVSSDFEKEIFRSRYDSPYFFSAHCFKDGFELRLIELTKVYRQEEMSFIDLLDSVRINQVDVDDLMELNGRFVPIEEDVSYLITLCATNAAARAINQKELSKIKDRPQIFKAKVEGEFKRSIYPTDEHLVLKEGAQVMFVKNDPQRQFVNGTIGEIVEIGNDQGVKVRIETNQGEEKLINVEKQEWEMIKYVKNEEDRIIGEVIGRFHQLPLKLAWAITIHKSQGKTFDQIKIDLGWGAFEFGQTYVALSRCRTLEGIYLNKPLKMKDIKVDERVVEYYEMMRRFF